MKGRKTETEIFYLLTFSSNSFNSHGCARKKSEVQKSSLPPMNWGQHLLPLRVHRGAKHRSQDVNQAPRQKGGSQVANAFSNTLTPKSFLIFK